MNIYLNIHRPALLMKIHDNIADEALPESELRTAILEESVSCDNFQLGTNLTDGSVLSRTRILIWIGVILSSLETYIRTGMITSFRRMFFYNDLTQMFNIHWTCRIGFLLNSQIIASYQSNDNHRYNLEPFPEPRIAILLHCPIIVQTLCTWIVQSIAISAGRIHRNRIRSHSLNI